MIALIIAAFVADFNSFHNWSVVVFGTFPLEIFLGCYLIELREKRAIQKAMRERKAREA